ncbi:MAG: septal ring lytic transglycosylase RlpA family protein [Cyanobacteria bacterium P01_C01_bin.89]
MSSFKLLRPWATATAALGLLAIAPAQSQVLNRASEGSSAIRVAQWQPSITPSESASLPSPSQALDGNVASTTQASTGVPTSASVITKVYAHEIDDQDAVTLYVRDIPVLTFLGDEPAGEDSAAESVTRADDANAELVTTPLERAQLVAQKLENLHGQLIQTETASDIRLEWDSEDEQYWITAGDRPLVALDEQTTAVQPSPDLNSDLVQTTNRLRRLVYGAEPIEYTSSRSLTNPAVAIAAPAPAPEAVAGGTVQSTQLGIASWYGGYFHGRRTASGERYNQNAMTAAHRHLPFGTRVRVVNLSNGQSTIVRINDRGPFIRGRIIDLSSAAAGQIGLRSMGIGRVRVEVLK